MALAVEQLADAAVNAQRLISERQENTGRPAIQVRLLQWSADACKEVGRGLLIHRHHGVGLRLQEIIAGSLFACKISKQWPVGGEVG